MKLQYINKLLVIRTIILILLVYGQTSTIDAQQRTQQRTQARRHGDRSGTTLNIVCSFSDYATIAKEIAGENAEISFIARGEQDPHFVPPKPSYAMQLKNANLWITTGMDLEMWSSTLLDKAHNKQIMDGEIGFVSVSDGVSILQKVEKGDRTEGDVHLMGNPHINTSPLNWKIMAENITIGLMKVDPANSEYYRKNRDAFIDRVDRALFGDKLVDMFGGETLSKMLDNQTFFEFLDKEYKGEKLINDLGGWLKKAYPFRGKKVVAYHKNWAYLAETFGLEIIGYIEPKPGIPPSAKHVQHIIQMIKDQNITLMLVASYFEKKSPQMIEDKTGVKALFLPLFVEGVPRINNNFQLVDYWIEQIGSNIN